ncbi:pleckstrin-like [Argonauta hians]
MDTENHSLKTGYLLKQGINRKWKARRFQLTEDHLIYHRKWKKRIGVSSLQLEGCSVVCPCLNTDLPACNPSGTFKICMPSGDREIYLQAAGEDERNQWAHAIGAVIRSLSTIKQVSSHRKVPFQNFRVYANVSEIIGTIQEPGAGVELGMHLRGGVVYRNCFQGCDLVNWLLRWSVVRNRDDGAAMAQTLLKLGHLQEIELNDGSSIAGERFKDGESLYRFTSLYMGAKRDSYSDNTDSDSSSSEEEDEEERESQKRSPKKGKVIKESFLLRKKNLSPGWQTVKVILRENPTTLEYHKATATLDSEKLSTVMDLTDCTVKEISRKDDDSISECKRYQLCMKDRKGRRLILLACCREECHCWLIHLSQFCKTTSASSVADTGSSVSSPK